MQGIHLFVSEERGRLEQGAGAARRGEAAARHQVGCELLTLRRAQWRGLLLRAVRPKKNV